MPVVVEPLASHMQVCAMKRGEYIPVVVAPLASHMQVYAMK